MIDLNYYATNITANVPAIAQVIRPQRLAASAVDTSALLKSVLSPTISNRVYPYKLPDNNVYPSITYEQTNADRFDIDDYPIAEIDGYIVAVQALTLADLISKSTAAQTALLAYAPANAAGSIEINNKASRWSVDLKRYEQALAVNAVHLALLSQAVPVLYLYPLHEKADPNRSINSVSQMIDTHFVALLAMTMPSSGITGIAPVRNAVLAQILGKSKPGTRDSAPQFVDGYEAGKVGSLVLWRDTFLISTPINYAKN